MEAGGQVWDGLLGERESGLNGAEADCLHVIASGIGAGRVVAREMERVTGK